MRLQELFDFAISEGVKTDPRGKDVVEECMSFIREQYEKLSEEEKAFFDAEKLTNPYPDTRILYGGRRLYAGEEVDVHTVVVGIDIEEADLLLVDRLSQEEPIDLVISHHPEGPALTSLTDVMYMQSLIFSKFGVPINIAEKVMQSRIERVERLLLKVNYLSAVSTAQKLGIPFMCIHTPADNHAASYLQSLFDRECPQRLGDVLDLLREQPEYGRAAKYGQGPKIVIGRRESYAGKVFVDMTGGTEGSSDIVERLAQAGVGTIVVMHTSEERFEKTEKSLLNMIIAGHMASDTLGMNLLLDKVEATFGELKIICHSGFERFRRI